MLLLSASVRCTLCFDIFVLLPLHCPSSASCRLLRVFFSLLPSQQRLFRLIRLLTFFSISLSCRIRQVTFRMAKERPFAFSPFFSHPPSSRGNHAQRFATSVSRFSPFYSFLNALLDGAVKDFYIPLHSSSISLAFLVLPAQTSCAHFFFFYPSCTAARLFIVHRADSGITSFL